jgi:thiamine monophosphate synthase
MSTANPRREVDVVDLSLYLVTGRHLLPPGMVSSSLSGRSLLTDSLSRVTSLLWKRSVAHFSALHNLTTTQTQALRGGVTVVQVREKNTDTAEVRLLCIKTTTVTLSNYLNSSSK